MKPRWRLDPEVIHLNHGSFGAAPIAVLEAQAQWRERLEQNPVRFMLESYQPALDAARERVAGFVGAKASNLVFVRNATNAANSILRSFEPHLEPGDEILVTHHGYNAVRNAAQVSADKRGAEVVVAELPLVDGKLAVTSPDQLFDAIVARVTDRTRLVIVDHISSPTAVVFPVERLVAHLEPEVPVLVDGAHAPGMLELDLEALGASYCIANLHKWVCGAKGVGYLYARPDRHEGLSSVVISHAHNGGWPSSASPFHAAFDWTGTDDPSPWFSIPVAIDSLAAGHPDGWAGVRARNHELAVAGRACLLEALGIEAPVPESMLGCMAAVPLPPGSGEGTAILDPMMAALRERWAIEVPVFVWPESPQRMLRVSAHLYNELGHYERLAEAVTAELARGT